MADFKVSLEALLPFCEEGLAVHPPAVLLAFEGPEASWIHYVPRLLLLLEGRNHIQFQRQGKLEEMTVSAPAIFFCARSGWLVNVREECPTRSLSFSFYPSYIRAMHVDYDGIHKPPTERDVFYHTRNPDKVPFDLSGFMYDEIRDSAEIKQKVKPRIETMLGQAALGEI